MLAVTDSDETNLVATFFANMLSPNTTKLARIRSEDYLSYQEALKGDPHRIDVIINPETWNENATHNYQVAQRNYSYQMLEERLAKLLQDCCNV